MVPERASESASSFRSIRVLSLQLEWVLSALGPIFHLCLAFNREPIPTKLVVIIDLFGLRSLIVGARNFIMIVPSSLILLRPSAPGIIVFGIVAQVTQIIADVILVARDLITLRSV